MCRGVLSYHVTLWQNLGGLGWRRKKFQIEFKVREKYQLLETITGRSPDCLSIPKLHTSSLNMSSDEIVWQVINQQFCSFKLKLVPSASSSFPPNKLEPQKRRTSAATNSMSPVSAIANPALSPIHVMPPSVQTPIQELCTST